VTTSRGLIVETILPDDVDRGMAAKSAASLDVSAVLAELFPKGCSKKTLKLFRNLREKGLGSTSISTIVPAMETMKQTRDHEELLHGLGDIYRFVVNVFVSTMIFIVIAVPAVGIELCLVQIRQRGMNDLAKFLESAKYAILSIDLALLVLRLLNHGWVYVRSFVWK